MAKEHVYTEGEKKNMAAYWESNPQRRDNLVKMVKHVNMLKPFPSEKSWEYIYYDRQVSDDMVDLALQMKIRTPYYIKDLAKLANKSVEEIAETVTGMCQVGLLRYDPDEDGVDRVVLEVFAPGNMETTGLDPQRLEDYPEMATAFKNYILDLQKKLSNFLPMGSALMRALPVEKAITNDPKKVKYEEVSYWLDKAGDSLAVSECQCRNIREKTDEGTADIRGEWCITLGSYADSAVRMGKARRITRAEAEDILRRAEERGYVHQLSNIDGPDFSVFICNCAWDSCMALKTSWYTQSPSWSRSNYIADVDKSKCVACGGCVEVCPQNAVKLGQKLCQKNPVKIEKTKIPDNHLFFGKENWQTEFLTNRANVVKETGTAPCKTSCPAHIAVQGYLKKAAEGDYKTALQMIKKENPFPAVCGSVCARFCEQNCTRGDVDEPVAIDEVKKFIAEQDMKSETRFVPEKWNTVGKKIAVIGAGPAGLSCAYYLAIWGHEVTVFEKEDKAGGMMTFGMPSFRLEKNVVDAEIDIVRELGVEIKTGVEVGKDITLDELRAQGYQGFYLAIGAQGGRKLGIEGEDAEGVISGIDFLREVALKKRTELPGKVVVIGGGNVAIDVSRSAVRLGAESVAQFSLEKRNEMPASEEEIVEAENENIAVNVGWGPKEILTENGKVKAIVFKKCTAVKDETGRFNPQYDENDTMTVECDFVLAAIGQSIQWGNMLDGSKVELNRNNTAKADSWTYQTAEPDVFVGGDAYTGPRFAIDAIAAGKEGAESLHRYVWEGHSLVLGRVKRDNYHYLDKDNLEIGDYDHAKRQRPGTDHSKAMSFSDERLTFTEEQVKAETARCLGCGAANVDQNICIGCGLCTTRCKFDAISLHREYDTWSVPYEKLVGHIAKDTVKRVGRTIKTAVKGE